MENTIALINAYHMFPQGYDWWKISKREGIKFVIITPNAYEHKILKEQGVDVIFLDNYFNNATETDLTDAKKELLARIKNRDFENFIETEFQYYHRNKKAIKKLAVKYYYAYKAIFSDLGIEKIIQMQGGEIVRRTANVAASSVGIRTIFVGESFISGKITLYNNEFKQLIIPKSKDKLPSDDYFNNILLNKLDQRTVIKYDTKASLKPKKKYFKKFLIIAQQKEKHILKTYISHKLKRKFVHYINTAFARYISRYSRYNSTAQYFFYPLNVAAESELFIRNPEFSNQVKTLEAISKNLPSGTLLYTKPHPGNEGHLKIRDYLAIKKMPNVRLLPASKSTYTIIANAIATIISSSTVGLESNMLQKPTVVLGNWPYTKLGQFHQGNTKTLGHILNTISNEKQGDSQIDPILTLKNIWKMSFQGSVWGDEEQLEEIIKEISLL